MKIIQISSNDGKEMGWVEVDKRTKTLEFIGVHSEFRGSGISLLLIDETFKWMKANKINSLSFLDNNPQFWQVVKSKFPKNIFISQTGEGKIVV